MLVESKKVGQPKIYRVSIITRSVRYVLRFIFRIIFHLICRVEIVGKDNIPADQGYMIAYNHISLFEPPFILTFWPSQPEAVAGSDVFDRPYVGPLVRAYKAIPVKRGEYDRLVLETVFAVLEAGLPLAISPEGSRSQEPGLQQAQAGVAYMIDRASVPVLPVGITGTTKNMLRRALKGQRPHLLMRIGEAFTPPPIVGKGEARRQERQANADLVMRKIAELIPNEYRGYYGKTS